ncbi:uncharacterized protein LOC144470528 [Augochlora pura]
MRLTQILYRNLIYVHKIPYRFRGKHRKEVAPTFKEILDYRNDIIREEQNMLLLKHPYLTREQSQGHMRKIKRERYKKVVAENIEEKNLKFNKRITIVDRLRYYMHNEAWE